jgi:predicted metal-dependent RNase
MGKKEQSLCGGYGESSENYTKDPIHSLVVESTCIEKSPVSFEEKRANFLGTIQRVWERGGNPLLPVLSLHRLQEILELINNSQKDGLLDDCKIILDAPLGMKVQQCIADMDPKTFSKRYGNDADYYKNEQESIDRFSGIINKANIIDSHEDSVNADYDSSSHKGKLIVIASGGMGEHGRSLNYLRGNFGQNPLNAVLFTCFQVEGTDGARMVRVGAIHSKGKDKSIKGAEIMKIDGFSSHVSGPDEAFGFLEQFNLSELEKVVITHGRDNARNAFAKVLLERGFKGDILLPKIRERIEI